MTSKRDVTNDFCASCVVLSSSCDNIYHHLYDLFAFFFLFDFFFYSIFFSVLSSLCVVLCKLKICVMPREEREEVLERLRRQSQTFLLLFSSHFPSLLLNVLGYIVWFMVWLNFFHSNLFEPQFKKVSLVEPHTMSTFFSFSPASFFFVPYHWSVACAALLSFFFCWFQWRKLFSSLRLPLTLKFLLVPPF